MTEENQDIENYGTMPDLDKLNQMNQERLQKDIPKKEIGGVKPEDKPKAIQEQ